MKGRHTAFQRFGSGSHNPFGFVLNKYFLTSESVRRDNIYEQTFSGRDVEKDYTDLGEEVFGCIAKGINTQGHLEGDTDEMTAKRKLRSDVEQYVLGSKGSILRSWEDENNKSYKDSVLIPQESLPLNVISKYPIKYSYDTVNDNKLPIVKDVDVPPSAGFSGPYLYRPKKFPSSFTPRILKEECVVESGRPVAPISIPSDKAHQILNCTKEIKITGDLDHTKDGSNKKCPGSSTLTVTQTYYLHPMCPGGSPIEKDRQATYTCTSSEEKGTLQIKGSISGTLNRYNILTSLWDAPVKLDLSPNFYQGSNAAKAYNFFESEGLDCARDDDEEQPEVDPKDYAKVKMLGEREKVTKLDAGCAVTPTLDIDIIRRDQGKNLLARNANVSDCNNGGEIRKDLILHPAVYTHGNLLGGKNTATHHGTLPSGPSLYGNYSAGLAEYVGLGGSEKIFKEKNCSASENESFRSPAGAPLKTGLVLSMKGECNVWGSQVVGLGISEFDGTDRALALHKFEQQNGCVGSYPGCCPSCSVYGQQGTYYLDCEKEKQCYSFEEENLVPHPSGGGYESKCSAPFEINFYIARYAEVGEGTTYEGLKYADAEVIPLDVQAKSADKQDLCIAFVFAGGEGLTPPQSPIIYPQIAYDEGGVFPMVAPLITTCKALHEAHFDLPDHEKEVVSVGSLTLKVGDWSTAIPLYTTHYAREGEECKGVKVGGIEGPYQWITACKRKTQAVCNNACDCCAGEASGGCGYETTDECNERVDCEPIKCSFSYSSSYNEDCPQTADCAGCQECGGCHGDCDGCFCCGCGCDCNNEGYEENPCPPWTPLPPTRYTGTGTMGCYGDGREKDILKTTCNITLEFIPFAEAGGVKQT